MKRHLLLGIALSAACIQAASADDLIISNKVTTPVSTLSAANATPGNITITSAGSVEINASAAAVTLNSNHQIVNDGTIANTFGAAATGVNIVAGNTGSFLTAGTINVPATSVLDSTNNFGILLNGTGTFTGNITATAPSTISVSGFQAKAISIQSAMTGNLTLGGKVQSVGTGAIGVRTAATITGAVVNTGTISTSGGGTSTTVINAVGGSGLAIGGNVTGGILNSGTIAANGNAAAFLVAPSVGGTSAITIGTVADGANPGFGILNRGNITATGDQPTVAPLAVQLGNSGNEANVPATFTGGFYNSGSITALSTSSTERATNLSPSATNAIAIVVNQGVALPSLVNDTAGLISAETGGPLGGNATALTIQATGSLVSLTNRGRITAKASASDTGATSLLAQTIVDATGTLTNITNSGTISAIATVLDNNAQATVAANLSAAAAATTFTNTGTVTGDILFGSSANNALTIEGASAIVTGRIGTAAAGRVNIAISGGGTGGTLVTKGAIQANTLNVGANGTLNLGIESATTLISASNNVNFAATSHLIITPISLAPIDAAITLIHSNTALNFDNFAATTAGFQIPFLFTGTLTRNAQNLFLNLHRKTATELGLSGDDAVIFEPAMQAASRDALFSGAIGTLANAAEVQAVLDQLLPVANNAAKTMVEAVGDPIRNRIGQHQRSLRFDMEPRGGVWAEGLYGLANASGSGGYKGHGVGGVLGAEYSGMGKGHVGIAVSIYQTDARERARLAKTEASWALVTPYMGFRAGNFFLDGQFTYGMGEVHSDRTVTAGTATRTASGKIGQTLMSGGVSSGYVFNLGGLQVSPEAGLRGFYLNDDDYTEHGGGNGVDLKVASRSQSSAAAFLGVSAQGSFTAFGGRLMPRLTGGWSEELLRKRTAIRAQFVSVPGTTFAISGLQTGSSTLVGSAGLDFAFDAWVFGVAYDGAFASKTKTQLASVNVVRRF